MASARATAAPIPVDAPVMRKTFWSRSGMRNELFKSSPPAFAPVAEGGIDNTLMHQITYVQQKSFGGGVEG